MNNNLYETNYGSYIEPIYGIRRNTYYDDILTNSIHISHSYSIPKNKRIDMTLFNTYSIDPINSKDADDAFSIYEENNKLYFVIHIADPTEYIELNSDLWKDIVKRVTTKYPSNREPIHMMPKKILELSTLQGPKEGTIKNAISILTEINPDTYEPINDIKLLFTNIFVKESNAFTYNEASRIINNHDVFKIALKISEQLKNKRALKTNGVKLNDITIAYPMYEDDYVYLYQDTPQEKIVKQMIAEFAIFANSFVGEYLNIHLNIGIFRSCNTNEFLKNIYNNITGEELLQEIITNGIRADYISNVEPHYLIGAPEYCHFTSPIRRLSDCVCHYLLKYIYFKNKHNHISYNMPFSQIELEELASSCLKISRVDKKNQYLDTKFRLLQVMHNMILNNKRVYIQYYITNYTGLFLNIIICKINDFNIHMSYTLRCRNYLKNINPKIMYNLYISYVNCFTDYDENTLPELNIHILS